MKHAKYACNIRNQRHYRRVISERKIRVFFIDTSKMLKLGAVKTLRCYLLCLLHGCIIKALMIRRKDESILYLNLYKDFYITFTLDGHET